MKTELLYEQSIVAQEDEETEKEKEGGMDEGAGDDEGMGTDGDEDAWEGHKEDEPAEM